MTDHTKDSRVLIDDQYLKVEILPGSSSDTLVFSCTGVGHASGGIDIQRREFLGSGCKHGSVVTVMDKTRSWGNRVDFAAISLACQNEISNARSILCVGNSMGAFNAVVLAKEVAAQSCIAFAPQFSVHPQTMPQETRWRGYVSKIDSYKYISLADQFCERTRYYLISGNDWREFAHWSQFPNADYIENIVVKGCGHEVARVMKKAGLLEDIFSSAISRSILSETIARAGTKCVDVNKQKLPLGYRIEILFQQAKKTLKNK